MDQNVPLCEHTTARLFVLQLTGIRGLFPVCPQNGAAGSAPARDPQRTGPGTLGWLWAREASTSPGNARWIKAAYQFMLPPAVCVCVCVCVCVRARVWTAPHL